METAKVDVRKLQLLNDRINQTIDALNQVRLSVHGLQHSSGFPAIGYGQPGIGFGQPGIGYGVGPFGQPMLTPPGVFPGQIGHTTPMGMVPPWVQQQLQLPFFPQTLPYPGIGGIGHTSPEAYETARYADPFWISRLQNTFPNAFHHVPPFVSLY